MVKTDYHNRNHKKTNKLMAFLGMPLIFSLGAYLLIYFFAQPIIVPLKSVIDMTFGDSAPLLDSENQYEGIVMDIKDINESSSNADVALPASEVVFPKYGDMYGRISIDGTQVDAGVYYGDNDKLLNKGACQYIGSKLPGFGGTILIAAHKNRHFLDLKSAEKGDIIKIATSYGVYEYTITDMKVVDPNDPTTYDLSATNENVILYTCYPFNMIGFSKQRYFVYAEYTSGPKVDMSK